MCWRRATGLPFEARDQTDRGPYQFLRRGRKHRLQMVADEQTHTLPDDVEGGWSRFGHFFGLREPRPRSPKGPAFGHLNVVAGALWQAVRG